MTLKVARLIGRLPSEIEKMSFRHDILPIWTAEQIDIEDENEAINAAGEK